MKILVMKVLMELLKNRKLDFLKVLITNNICKNNPNAKIFLLLPKTRILGAAISDIHV